MADYWISNPRKYCELCKCWLADNKISVQNHEFGMRHKANVAKKVAELTKGKSSNSEKKKLQESLQTINDKAHLAMMKDIEKDPSLAKRYGVDIQNLKKVESSKQDPPVKLDVIYQPILWKECLTADGKCYYWNSASGETQWEKPNAPTEPINLSVKCEKGRLQQFVFNKLIELSEGGSVTANEAVLQTFNEKPVDEPPKIPAKMVSNDVNNNVKDKKPEKFLGPTVQLLGQWTPCDESPPQPKMLKLDLPDRYSRISNPTDAVIKEKVSLISHLEHTTERNVQDALVFHPHEKTVLPGSISQINKKLPAKSDSTTNNAPEIVFRQRKANTVQSNLRTSSSNDD